MGNHISSSQEEHQAKGPTVEDKEEDWIDLVEGTTCSGGESPQGRTRVADEGDVTKNPTNPAAKAPKNETSLNLLENVGQFLNSYDEMEKMAQELGLMDPALIRRDIMVHSGGIRERRQEGGGSNNNFYYKPAYQQQCLDGAPVQNLEDLYVAAEAAQPTFCEFLNNLVQGVGEGVRGNDDDFDIVVQHVNLKSRKRAKEKALDDYFKRKPGSCFSWLFDINRASVVCTTVAQIEQVVDWLESHSHIVQAKHRFRNPSSSGYRDLNFHLRLECCLSTNGGHHKSAVTYFHVVEVQVHHSKLKQLDMDLGSHARYEFFRTYFSGADKAVRVFMGKLGALNILREVLKSYLSMHQSEEDPEEYECVADTYCKVAAVVADLGYYSLATKLQDKARGIFRRVLGPDDQCTVDSNRHYAEYLSSSDKSKPRDNFEIELEKEFELQEGWTPPSRYSALAIPKGVAKRVFSSDLVIDAFFVVDCHRLSWYHNLNDRPQLLANLDEICNYVKKDALDNPNITGDLRDFLTKDYHVYFSGGRASDMRKALEERSRIRLFVWFAKGVNECSVTSGEFMADVFGGDKHAVVDVLVVCMEIGAERMARAIYELMNGRVGRVVWMCLDPYCDHDAVDVFTKALLPFCARFLPGTGGFTECIDLLSGCYSRECDCYPPRDGETATQEPPVRHPGTFPNLVKSTSWFCANRNLRRLKVAAMDLLLVDPNTKGKNLIEKLSKGTSHRCLFLLPDTGTERMPRRELEKACKRSRSLSLYAINEIASCIHQSEYQERKIHGFQNGIFLVGSKNDMKFAEDKLKGKGLHALLWLDFATEEMAELFPDARELAGWIFGFGDRIVLSLVITSNEKYFGHVEMVRMGMEEQLEGAEVIQEDEDGPTVEVDHLKIPRKTIGAHVPVDALLGTIKILPVARQNRHQDSLLDESQDPRAVVMALEQALFATQDRRFCSVTSLYRDTDGSVIVGVFLRDVKFLTALRDRALGQQAAKLLAEKLPNFSQQDIQFDPNSIASLYETMMLQLETLTDHQQEQLAKCKETTKSIHIKAKAGTGKTFIALNSILDYLETNTSKESRVLFVCCNLSLAFHFCKWFCFRFKNRKRQKALTRLCFLTATVTGSPALHRMEYDAENALLQETQIQDEASSVFGMIVVDEAHGVFQKDSGNSLHRQALKHKISKLLKQNQSARLLLLSDMSQTSVPEDAIEFPHRDDWTTVELNEVCRSSKRILVGSRSFQLGKDSEIPCCAHESDGLPLRALLFPSPRNKSDMYKNYTDRIVDALEEVKYQFPGLDLHHRLAIIVPDKAFRDALCRVGGPLWERLSEFGFNSVTAMDASMSLNTKKTTLKSHIIVDTVDEVDGLESLVVFGVGLDKSINGAGKGPPRIACSRIYRAITRAQMLFYLINVEIQGGWLEWLGRLELDENDMEPINLERELSQLSNRAAIEVVMDDERQTIPGRRPFPPSIAERGQEPLALAANHPLETAVMYTEPADTKTMPKRSPLQEDTKIGSGDDVQRTQNRVWQTSASDSSVGGNSSMRGPYFDPRVLKEVADPSTASSPSDDQSQVTTLQEESSNNLITVLLSAPLVYKHASGQLLPFPQLNLDMEREVIWQCLKEASRDIDLAYDTATPDRLLAAMAHQCTCLHFSGHGHEHLVPFEDETGGTAWFTVEKLRQLIEREGSAPFDLVFISACHSGLAGQVFASTGVPHVVCCRQEFEINDVAARRFTRQFYLALAVGNTVRESFEQGCRAAGAGATRLLNAERDKFILLPHDGNHNVPIFDARPVGEWPKHNIRSAGRRGLTAARTHELKIRNLIYEYPSPSQFFLGREVVMHKTLNELSHRRLVSIVGEPGIGRSSLAKAVCHYINERKSIVETWIERIYFFRVKRLKKNRFTALAMQLHKLLVEEGLAGPVVDGEDKDEIVDSICNGLQREKALVVFDRVELLEVEEEMNDFIMLLMRSLWRNTSCVKILLTHTVPVRFPELVEDTIVLGPLNLEATIRLFAHVCPYIHSSAERRGLVDALLPDDDDDDEWELLYTEGLPAHIKRIFEALGKGIPARIIDAAYSIDKVEQLPRLMNGSIRYEEVPTGMGNNYFE